MSEEKWTAAEDTLPPAGADPQEMRIKIAQLQAERASDAKMLKNAWGVLQPVVWKLLDYLDRKTKEER